jgi:hypothetical protein
MTSPASQTPNMGPATSGQTPVIKRPGVKLALGVTGALLALCAFGAVVSQIGGGDKSPESASAGVTSATPSSTTPAPEPTPTQGPATVPPHTSNTASPAAPRTTKASAKTTQKRTTPPAEPTCDPNYAWACVPIASDVDCAGGSGNGPAYVQGPVKVIGYDIYDLDRDGDGIGCE